MSGLPVPSTQATYKRVTGANPAAGVEVQDTVPVATNEQQTIAGTASQNFGLAFQGEVGPVTLTPTATAPQIQAYLRAFQSLGPDGVTVAGGPLPGTITITFNGLQTSGKFLPALTVVGGATGLTITTTVPGVSPKFWWLLAVTVQLVQGLTQTPQPSLVIDDGTTNILTMPGSTAAQAASTTAQYTWAGDLQVTGLIGTTPGIVAAAPLPQNLILPPGYRIKTVTSGIGANSDYGAPSYYVCEMG